MLKQLSTSARGRPTTVMSSTVGQMISALVKFYNEVKEKFPTKTANLFTRGVDVDLNKENSTYYRT